jgi:hypothetical protein
VSETALALGLPAEWEWAGRRLKVSPPNFKVEGLLARELSRRTYQGLHGLRAEGDDAAHAEHVRQFNDDLACNEFDYAGRVYNKALTSATGTKEWVWVCLSVDDVAGRPLNPDFTRADLEEIFRDPPKWNELVGLINQLRAVPKNGRTPPAAGATANPSAPPT